MIRPTDGAHIVCRHSKTVRNFTVQERKEIEEKIETGGYIICRGCYGQIYPGPPIEFNGHVRYTVKDFRPGDMTDDG